MAASVLTSGMDRSPLCIPASLSSLYRSPPCIPAPVSLYPCIPVSLPSPLLSSPRRRGGAAWCWRGGRPSRRSSIVHSTVLYSTVLSVQYSIIQYTVQYCTVPSLRPSWRARCRTTRGSRRRRLPRSYRTGGPRLDSRSYITSNLT